MKPPHLVVIMADQLRHDLIGPEHTPNIAALAAESAVFPNFHLLRLAHLRAGARGLLHRALSQSDRLPDQPVDKG